MSAPASPAPDARRPRGRLFWKYVVVIVALVTTLLVASGGVELWFSYQESRDALVALQREKAAAAAGRIEAFIREIERQMGWTTLPLLAAGAAALEQRRIDFVRLQRQVPPITDLQYLDAEGKEQLRVSRLAMDVVGSGIDLSADPRFTQAIARKVYHGPVYFRKESEPYMVVAMAQSGGGVTVAEVNLKFIWDVVTQIKIGKAGRAYVIDEGGTLIAHPDISLVLQKTSLSTLPQVVEALAPTGTAPSTSRDVQGRRVLTAHATIPGLRWAVFAEQPLEEALAPIEASLKRSLLLLAIGVSLAIGASLVLARRMVRPIQALQVGAARIGAGELGHRIAVRTGDELETLAREFNRMTAALQESLATLEQRVVERTQELTEALERQNATGEILRVISSSPTDVQPVFDAIVASAVRLCDGSQATAYRFDGVNQHFVAHYAVPAAALDLLRARYPHPPDPAAATGLAILERAVVHVPDILADPRFSQTRSSLGRAGALARSVLAVPMVRNQDVLGAIFVTRGSGTAQPFSETQIELLQTFADQAVIAIENVRLFTELQTKNAALTESLEQQTATSEILRVISSSPTDTQPVFDTIIRNAVRLSGATWGLMCRVEGGLIDLVAHHNIGDSERELFRRIFPRPVGGAGPLGRVVGSGQILRVADVHAEDVGLSAEGLARMRERGVRSTVVVPMFRHGQVIGTINLTHQAVGAFSDAHVALIRTFADQAVIAIENVRLFKELEARNADLGETLEQQTGTAEILRVISSSPTDLAPVFDAILEKATQLCDAQLGLLGRCDGQRYEHVAHRGAPPEFEQDWMWRPKPYDASTGVGRMIATGEPVHIPDITDDPAYHSRHPVRMATVDILGARTFLGVPMLKEGRIIGGIVIYRREVRPFSDKQIDLVKTFADQAVIAIENVRLFTELESRNAALSESLEQQTSTSEILRVISRSPSDLAPVFETIARSAARLCDAAFGAVLRIEADMVVPALAANEESTDQMEFVRRAFPIPVERAGAIAEAVRGRRVVHVHDFLAEHGDEPDYLFTTAQPIFGYRTILVVPMLREETAIGGILLWRTEARPFTDKQIEVVRTFADQGVIAVENVRLFKELESRNADVTEALEQQTATAEILRVINAAQVDLQPVFEAIAASAVRLCDGLTGGVFLVEDGQVRPAAHYNFVTEAFEGVFPAPLDSDLFTARAIVARGVVHTPDVLAEPDYRHRALAERLGFRGLLSVPMMREGSPIGAITVTRAQPGRFTDKQIALLQTFADQAVIAIENVRLLQEVQARNAALTESLEQQTATAEILRVISRTQVDVQPVFETIVHNAVTLCDGRYGVVYRWDGRLVHVVAHANIRDGLAEWLQSFPRELRPDGHPDLLRPVVLGGEVVRIDDTATDPCVPDQSLSLSRGVRSNVLVPMRRGNEVLGVIAVSHSEPSAFTDARVDLLRTFADQAVIAIENVRLFTELQERTSQLQVANRHKDEFLANMSHELRTPLNAIIGFSEVMLERMFGELTDKQEEYLNDILDSGRHLLSLINDILDLSKIEAGRMELELADFNLPVAIDNALTLVHERGARRGLTLTQEVDGRLGEFRGDERKIKQVLLNLLSNAIKFTPEGGKVQVRAHLKGAVVEIAVADTGVGIAPEDQELVFEEFQQVGTDVTKKHEGTGLGLALARRFVELHGGNLWLESEVGVGSTFTFELPVRRD